MCRLICAFVVHIWQNRFSHDVAHIITSQNLTFCIFPGLPVIVADEEESVLLGGAIIGATAAGLYPTVQVSHDELSCSPTKPTN